MEERPRKTTIYDLAELAGTSPSAVSSVLNGTWTKRRLSQKLADPDRISAFCAAAGVQSLNLDLPGSGAPSVISDNFTGARDLPALILDHCLREFGSSAPLRFVGGPLERPRHRRAPERLPRRPCRARNHRA